MTPTSKKLIHSSILVMSPDRDLAERFANNLGGAANKGITIEGGSLSEMNGRASSLIACHDVVIFDARANSQADLEALSTTLRRHSGDTLFLALADDNLPISMARKLRDAGIGEVLPNTTSGADLERIIVSLLHARQISSDAEISNGAIIAVSQARGGIGSTTVAVNLAQKLVGKKRLFRSCPRRSVALVDFDIQFGNANALLDLEDKGGMLDLVQSDQAPDATYLSGIMQSHERGLHVLCAPAPLVPISALSPETVADTLDVLRRKYDYVVVDLPRALVEWVAPVLERASHVVLITDTSVPSIRHARRLMDFYHQDNPALRIEFIVNRESRPMIKSPQVREAERVLNARLSHWLPDAPREARKAADLGQPIVNLFPGSAIGKAFSKLAADTVAALPDISHKSS